MRSLLRRKAMPPLAQDPAVRSADLQDRLDQVIGALAALETKPGELEETLTALRAADPWSDHANRARLTSIVARLNFSAILLAGFIGQHNLVSGADEFSKAAMDRRLLPQVNSEAEKLVAREERRRRAS